MKKIVLLLTVILLMVVALPFTFFFIKQASNLTENESIVQQAFEQQLETILFTINQNSENYILSWVNQLDVPVDCNSEIMAEIVAQLFLNNRSIEEVGFYNSDNSKNERLIKRTDRHILTPPSNELNKSLSRFLEQGYRRVETIRNDEHTFLYFKLKSGVKDITAAFAIHNKTFVEQSLGSGIQQIAQNRFGISIVDTVSLASIYSFNTENNSQQNEHQQAMWYIPGAVISISLLSATINDLVLERAQRESYLFYLMVLFVLIGVVFVIFTVRREVKLAEMKSEFVSNVSHEIRTPLALISMYSETLLLKRVKNEEKANEYLNIIFHETNRLAALVNRILSFSKMEKKKREYHFSNVDVNALITEVIDNFEPHFKEKKVKLTYQLDQNISPIFVDREAIVETIINLIDNAVKYGKDENKQIEIRTKINNQALIIDIEDNGLGISKKHQKLIFDKFYRVTEGSLAHKAKGSGLGLNIVKKIMDKHNGKIVLRSSEGVGSCFSLIFPLNNKKNGKNTDS